MQREIKYRAYDKQYKQMKMVNMILFSTNEIDCVGDLGEPKSIDHFELMQFTGLYDTGGKEIYEGDIIITANDERHTVLFGQWSYPSHIDTDSFVSQGIGFHIDGVEPFGPCILGDGSMYQVIGNIYETPELIK